MHMLGSHNRSTVMQWTLKSSALQLIGMRKKSYMIPNVSSLQYTPCFFFISITYIYHISQIIYIHILIYIYVYVYISSSHLIKGFVEAQQYRLFRRCVFYRRRKHSYVEDLGRQATQKHTEKQDDRPPESPVFFVVKKSPQKYSYPEPVPPVEGGGSGSFPLRVREWLAQWPLSKLASMAASAYLTSPGGPPVSSEQSDEGRNPSNPNNLLLTYPS